MIFRVIRFLILLHFSISLSNAQLAGSVPLQIIHTNDLHSHLEHAQDPSIGGYAALKKTIDRIKKRAQIAGIETLVLDAGDFLEGSQFYMAARGRAVWNVMNSMGYDAVVIGNHDWLMGPAELDLLLQESPPHFSFLAANFIFESRFRALSKHLRPYAEFIKNGLKVAVLGLTTNEFLYSWVAKDGIIVPPAYEANLRLPEIRKRNDIVIALTHIGIQSDRSLVRQTSGIDLVVGGHSHLALHEPVYEYDQRGVKVPIVQSGEHAHYVGDLLIDIKPGEPLKVLRFRLVPVTTTGASDQTITDAVKAARAQLEKTYGPDWLYEVVGKSEVPLLRQTTLEQTTWSTFLVESYREATQADLSFDAPTFSGLDQPAGPITREQIIMLFPRMLSFEQPLGWTIWTANVSGWVLHSFIQEALKVGFPITLGGVTYNRVIKNGKITINEIRVNGKTIDPKKDYRVALSEGVGRGAIEVSPLLRKFLRNPTDTGIPIWSAIEGRMKKVGVIRP